MPACSRDQRAGVGNGFVGRNCRSYQSRRGRHRGRSRLLHIRVVNLVRQAEGLCRLPDDAVIGHHHFALRIGVADVGERAHRAHRFSRGCQALEVLVVVGHVHVRVGVANIPIHRDVLDARALQPEDLGRIEDARRLPAQIAGHHGASSIHDRQAAVGVRRQVWETTRGARIAETGAAVGAVKVS